MLIQGNLDLGGSLPSSSDISCTSIFSVSSTSLLNVSFHWSPSDAGCPCLLLFLSDSWKQKFHGHLSIPVTCWALNKYLLSEWQSLSYFSWLLMSMWYKEWHQHGLQHLSQLPVVSLWPDAVLIEWSFLPWMTDYLSPTLFTLLEFSLGQSQRWTKFSHLGEARRWESRAKV